MSATPTRKIGTGLLLRDGASYVGDVTWFGYPIGVRITREGDAVRCDFYNRPMPDWAAVPMLDEETPT